MDAEPEPGSDADLRQMLEGRDAVKVKRQKTTSRLVTAVLLAIVAGTGTWFATSESAQAKARYVIASMQQAGKDIKGLGSIMGTYEKQLDKVSVQGARIDAATAALGVDPETDTSAQGAAIEGEMKKMSGEEGPTVSERDQAMKAKFGIVSKLAGEHNPKVERAESDVKF